MVVVVIIREWRDTGRDTGKDSYDGKGIQQKPTDSNLDFGHKGSRTTRRPDFQAPNSFLRELLGTLMKKTTKQEPKGIRPLIFTNYKILKGRRCRPIGDTHENMNIKKKISGLDPCKL
jgi:hypothetical protein